MWPLGDLVITSAEAPPEANSSLIVLVGGIVVAAMAPLGYVVVEIVKGYNARKASSSAQPASVVDVLALAQDVAVLKDWRVETRKADDLHDRAVHEIAKDVEDLVRFNDREHPEWRP